MNNENNIDLHSYDTSSSSSDYLEPPYYTSSLPVSILADASFAILSALTGAAILANNYSGYNLAEAFTISLTGSPFLMVYGAVAGLYCGSNSQHLSRCFYCFS